MSRHRAQVLLKIIEMNEIETWLLCLPSEVRYDLRINILE
mgnify:CR=1 FL=1